LVPGLPGTIPNHISFLGAGRQTMCTTLRGILTEVLERRGPQGQAGSFLLPTLTREEYDERIFGASNRDLLADLQTPDPHSVRITDLRLAASLEPKVLHTPGSDSGLVPALRSLSTPITTSQVIQWKRKTLEDGAELLKQEFGDLRKGAIAVSFSAAALCLFVDFDMPNVEDAKPYRLAEQIETLAKTIKGLISSLNGAGNELETLLANRPAHKPPRSDNEYYQALWSYRIGCGLEDIADWVGITPWNSATPERGGTKGSSRYLPSQPFQKRFTSWCRIEHWLSLSPSFEGSGPSFFEASR